MPVENEGSQGSPSKHVISAYPGGDCCWVVELQKWHFSSPKSAWNSENSINAASKVVALVKQISYVPHVLADCSEFCTANDGITR